MVLLRTLVKKTNLIFYIRLNFIEEYLKSLAIETEESLLSLTRDRRCPTFGSEISGRLSGSKSHNCKRQSFFFSSRGRLCRSYCKLVANMNSLTYALNTSLWGNGSQQIPLKSARADQLFNTDSDVASWIQRIRSDAKRDRPRIAGKRENCVGNICSWNYYFENNVKKYKRTLFTSILSVRG